MKKTISAFLLVLLFVPVCFSGVTNEWYRLEATTTVQVHTFTNPSKILTIQNDGDDDVCIKMESDTVTTDSTSGYLGKDESVTIAFDIAGINYGISKFAYVASGSTATIRVFSIND